MKKFIIIFVSVLFLILISLIALPFIFKDKIIAMVKETANESVNAKIDFGAFDLSIISSFPDFRFEIEKVSVIGVDTFQFDTLAYVGRLAFDVDVMSVINGEQYKINSIAINDALIKAKVLENGKANWDIAKVDTTAVEAPVDTSVTKFNIAMKNYEITNSTIIYDDASLKFYTKILNLNHEGKGDFTQDIFLLATNTSIDEFTMDFDGVKYLNKVKTALKFDIDMDMPNMKFTFKENEFQMNELFLGFDGWVAMPKDDIDMDVKFFAKKTDFKNILSMVPAVYMKDFSGLKTSGKLILDGSAKGIYNDKSYPAFVLNAGIENGNFQYPDLPKAVNNVQMKLNIEKPEGDLDLMIIDLSKFHLEMAGNPFDITMLVKKPMSDPDLKGAAVGKIDFNSLKDVMPPTPGMEFSGKLDADVTMAGQMSSLEKEEYDKFDLKGQMTLTEMNYQDSAYTVFIEKMTLNFAPQFVELTELNAKTKKSDFAMSGRIDNLLQYYFKGDILSGNFNLNSNVIDVSEFMSSDETALTETTADTASSDLSVIEVPGNLDLIMTTNIGKLIYDNLDLTNLKGRLTIKDKKIDLSNLSMNLLDGSMVMNGYYESYDLKAPTFKFLMDIKDFDVQKTATYVTTVEKMVPMAKSTFGKFSTKMDVIGVLDEKMMPIYNSLTGGGRLQTKEIEVRDFQPMVKLAEAIKQDKYKKLYVGNADLSFKFLNGRVYVDPFEIKTGKTTAKISGSNGFDQSIDYLWALTIPREEFGAQANQLATGLLNQFASKTGVNVELPPNVKINANIAGTVTQPKISLGKPEGDGTSTSGGMVDDAKKKLQEEMDKKKAELEAKAREEADKLKKEAEAKAKAEVDKLKKEAEDKAKAEADRLKKEAEAKAKAEAERLKKEAEDKLKGLFKKK